jgi:hypothetical protein
MANKGSKQSRSKRSKSIPAEIVGAILTSPPVVQIGESLNEKLRQVIGLPPQGSSSKLREEAKGVTDKIREMKAAPYRVLGVNPSAEEQVIKAAYKAMAKLFHPDVAGGSNEKMAEINEAYKQICQERGWKI